MITGKDIRTSRFLRAIALSCLGGCATAGASPIAGTTSALTAAPCDEIPTCAGCELHFDSQLKARTQGTIPNMPSNLQSAKILVDASPTDMTPMPVAGNLAFPLPQPLPSPPSFAELRIKHRLPGGTVLLCKKTTLRIVADNP